MVPMLAFALLHLLRVWRRPNRYAVGAGLGLLAALVLLFVSGILLTRLGFFEVNDPGVRRFCLQRVAIVDTSLTVRQPAQPAP